MKSQFIPPDHFVEIGNLRFHYLDWGDAGPPLIFIPGYGWTAHIFYRLALHFTDSFHVLGFTRRGHGKSDKTSNGYDIPTLASDIGSFINELGFESAHFVGHSLGGYEISQLAAEYPSKVSSLTFLDSALNPVEWVDDTPDPVDIALAGDQPVIFESYEDFIAHLHHTWPDFKRIWRPVLDMAIRETLFYHEDGSIEEIISKEIESTIIQNVNDFRHSYDRIMCPALALFALNEVSSKLPDDASDELREQSRKYTEEVELPWLWDQMGKFKSGVRDSKIVEIWNATHHIYIDHEEEVVREIRDFLKV